MRHKFVPCRRVAHEMGEPYASQLELISFHTVSKGVYGECGLRGGYFDMMNIHPGTVAELYKVASINLCPNTVGQLSMALMAKEPSAGAESYESFTREKQELLESLKRKAHMMTDFFNSLQGVECTFTEGAMYSFPAITCASCSCTAYCTAPVSRSTPHMFESDRSLLLPAAWVSAGALLRGGVPQQQEMLLKTL